MAAVKNAVSRALADGPLSHPGMAKRAFERARSWLDFASKATTEEGATMIPDNATIVTCSHSATVVDVLRTATRNGKQLRVLVLESRVGDRAYGTKWLTRWC
jgi:translation initiation factor 2B subunit (eIF-2B alpha/beta/delta family)